MAMRRLLWCNLSEAMDSISTMGRPKAAPAQVQRWLFHLLLRLSHLLLSFNLEVTTSLCQDKTRNWKSKLTSKAAGGVSEGDIPQQEWRGSLKVSRQRTKTKI